jgi:hypothetical protein
MSNYHLTAIRHALKTVQLSGEPCKIGGVYEDHLPIGTTLAGLVKEFGLTMKICKSSGAAIIEKPFRRNG